MKRAIQFVRWWRGREPGTVDRQLDLGVMDVIVRRGFAVWFEEEPKSVPPFKGMVAKKR